MSAELPIAELVERALSRSASDGCIVIATERTEANLRWAGNSLTTNGQMQGRHVTVVSTIDTPAGVASGMVSGAVSTTGELDALVVASEQAARSAGPADDAAPLVEPYDSSDDWHRPAAGTGIEVFADFAPALGRAFDTARSHGRLLYGFAEHIVESTFLATSAGLRRRYDQPTGRVELNGKSADLTRSAWAGLQTRDFADVDVEALTADVEQRLDWAATRVDLPAGRYETLLPPTAVADLLLSLYWTGSSRDAEEGRTVFSAPGGRTRIGDQLAPLPLTLRSNPDEPGLECTPFEVARSSSGGLQSVFDNGMPLRPTSWIEAGRLQNLVRTRNWAGRTGAAPCAAVDNLILDGGGTATLAEMIAGTERGLLLTCLWYIREVDPQTLLLTGLTRDGVYLIENGAVVGAVNNFRFNESPVDLLGRITEVGRSEMTLPREWNDYFTRTVMPPVRVPDFNMSTVSQAS
jgi:predicted Zn-dependent protease